MACRIYIAYRIIIAIREHIMADNSLAGGGVGVGVEEAAGGRVVISALQIIEPGIGVVVVAAVAQGVAITGCQWVQLRISIINITCFCRNV